jgi:hypothetical protein
MSEFLTTNRRALLAASVLLLATVLTSSAAMAQWVNYVDETAGRVSAAPERMVTDPEEKDYAWGDVDRDGDVDLVVVRKEPFTSAGKFPNFLFLNMNGVLTDRTEDFATSSDVAGDEGFNTPTNDRDVVLADVNLDGWLDIVTAVTVSDGDPKHIGHPRVYRNLGCISHDCDDTTASWGGFRYEEARIPEMVSWTGQSNFNPRFCSVFAGDVTGDGYPDLWFGDYDSSGAGGNEQPSGADYNDRLLINQGASNPGYFVDETLNPGSRFFGNIQGGPFPVSAFGAAANIADMNNDGVEDIVKQTSLQSPTYVGIAYNDPNDEGIFNDNNEVIYDKAPYFVSVGDLNNDGRLDLVITDDNADRYMINEGNGAGNRADFTEYVFSFNHTGPPVPPSSPGENEFGSNSVIADLDKDGWNDVLIADVDVDIGGCGRRTRIYRNLGNPLPNGYVNIQEQTTGTSCNSFDPVNSTCIVTGFPTEVLQGTHDIAVFDINGDTWLDLVIGRCDGTEVYINQPPIGPAGSINVDEGQSQQLLLDKSFFFENLRLDLAWGESCLLLDDDYSIYEGTLDGDFTDHQQVVCSTEGATIDNIAPQAGDRYYLVVPHNGTFEGGYGFDSAGSPRQQGAQSCRPMQVGSCD